MAPGIPAVDLFADAPVNVEFLLSGSLSDQIETSVQGAFRRNRSVVKNEPVGNSAWRGFAGVTENSDTLQRGAPGRSEALAPSSQRKLELAMDAK
jgi:hypothetical protein